MADERVASYLTVTHTKRCIRSPTGLTPDGKKIKTENQKLKWTPNSIRMVYEGALHATALGLEKDCTEFWNVVADHNEKKRRTGYKCIAINIFFDILLSFIKMIIQIQFVNTYRLIKFQLNG